MTFTRRNVKRNGSMQNVECRVKNACLSACGHAQAGAQAGNLHFEITFPFPIRDFVAWQSSLWWRDLRRCRVPCLF